MDNEHECIIIIPGGADRRKALINELSSSAINRVDFNFGLAAVPQVLEERDLRYGKPQDRNCECGSTRKRLSLITVKLLVVMYSINVFLTFTLSQLGMCRHWWDVRKSAARWRHGLFVNGFGLVLTATILCVTVTTKFTEGGWITIFVTLVFVLLCQAIRWHYDRVGAALKRLDDTLLGIPFQPDLNAPAPVMVSAAPTAAIIVRDFDGVAVHTLLNIQRLFPNHFKNVIFISVGVIDTGQFKGHAEIENLRRKKEDDLRSFVDFAVCLGWYAEYRYDLGVDLMAELEQLCDGVAKEFPRVGFFSGKLVFEQENMFTRWLHNHTPFTLQQRLQFAGRDMMILPIRVFVAYGTAQTNA